MGQLIILLQKEWKYKKKEKKTISAFNHHAVCPTPESLTATQPTTTILYLFIDLIGQPIFLYILSFKAHVSFYFYFFFSVSLLWYHKKRRRRWAAGHLWSDVGRKNLKRKYIKSNKKKTGMEAWIIMVLFSFQRQTRSTV